MKNIKDYLHLYLGCEIVWKDKRGYWFPENRTHIEFTNTKDRIIYMILLSEAKPLLRPLSDITEEELRQCSIVYCEGHNNCDTEDVCEWIAEWAGGAAITKYLLSKHFDLFGLIESGLAIDKTKLNRVEGDEWSVAREAK